MAYASIPPQNIMPQDAIMPVSDPSPLSPTTEMVELRHTSPLGWMGGMSVLPRYHLVWEKWAIPGLVFPGAQIASRPMLYRWIQHKSRDPIL